MQADVLGGLEAIGDGFTKIADVREGHQTPSGTIQPFVWLALRRMN